MLQRGKTLIVKSGKSREDIHVVVAKALGAGLFPPKVLVPNALPVAFDCPNKPVFDVAGWDGFVEENAPPPVLKADVPPPPNAPNPALGFVVLNIDGLLLPAPNAPDEELVRRKPRWHERDKPNVEPPVAGVGLGLEARFPNIEFAGG